MLLLHDIHPATAMALPMLLKELKAKGYKIVQAVPAAIGPNRCRKLYLPLQTPAAGPAS